MQIDKQKVTLVITKYMSYLINIVIVGIVLTGILWWVLTLIKSAQA